MPEDLAPDELTVEKAEELLAAPSGDRSLGMHPEWEREIVVKNGRYGPYVTEVLAGGRDGEAAHRRRSSSRCRRRRVTLDDAVRLLSLPRVLGAIRPTARRSPPRTAATART